MRRRLAACVLVTVALAGAGGSALAADKPVKRPPTQLWNAFPLHEKPAPAARGGVAAASATRLGPLSTPASVPLVGADSLGADSAERLTTVVLLLELALMLGAIGVAIVLFRPDLKPLPFAHATRARRLSTARRGRRKPRRVPRAAVAVPSEVGPPLMPRLARPAPVPVVESADERCRVYWRPGYVSAQFVAKISPQAKAAIAVSPTFRWRKATAPLESDASTGALAAIVHELEQEGWIAAGPRGREWFELEFVRPRTAADACRIEWTHAYATGRFRAVVTKADGSRAVVAESSDLRALRGRPPDRGKPAYSAFDELVAKLARLGWTASGRGDEWFAVAFVRTPPTAAGLQQRRLGRET